MTTNAAGLVNQALEALKAKDRIRAASLLRDVVRQDPPLGATWGSVARLAATIGEGSLAVTAAQRHVALKASDVAARLNLGQLLAQNGRHREALALGEALTRDQPRNAATWHFVGVCRAQLGDDPGAVQDFRRAIELQDQGAYAAWSWLPLANAKTFDSPQDPDIAAMQALADQLGTEPVDVEARSMLSYAIGKALDDTGQTDRAFVAYCAGAATVNAGRNYAPEASDAFVETVVRDFDAGMLKRLPRGIDSDRPIFVLGLPRSGTTLVEQILVSHDAVTDGAELNLFRAAAMPVGGFSPEVIAAYATANPQGFAQIGHDYLHLLQERFGADGRIVDKTLNHSRYLGLIHAVLPKARMIWLRRDPAAIAWSCFRTRFSGGVDWSWSLDHIGRHFRAEDRLHAHWTQLLGDTVLTVPYDDLVADPETWIPRMIEHVGLPWQDGLQDFHKTERAVATASVSQVRQPIHTRSREAWRKYETHLKPFFDAYQSG